VPSLEEFLGREAEPPVMARLGDRCLPAVT
jgi:hypothetical protein